MKRLKKYRYYLFLLLGIIVVRSYVLESYVITSGSMSSELRTGDYVMLSKLRYGPRVPRAWKLPFMDYESPFIQASILPTSLKFHDQNLRLWKRDVERNDIIAFDPPDKKPEVSSLYVSYIKRCVGLPGDQIKIQGGELYVNQQLADVYYIQDFHAFYTSAEDIPPALTVVDKEQRLVELRTSRSVLDPLVDQGLLTGYFPIIKPQGFNDLDIFPHSLDIISNEDNIPEFTIPFEGFTIPLTTTMVGWYGECIELYEGKTLKEDPNSPGSYLLNGEPTETFTFEHNYYWAIGDNWDNSIDSRFWGLFPERNIIGKASFVWFSKNGGIRWERIFKGL
ncbi:MAG: signal peptidase I [Bacteroidota bacterium]